MSQGNSRPFITALKVGAALAALALFASAVTASLMATGVLRASSTRFAALGLVALAFVNWLVRLLLEVERHGNAPAAHPGAADAGEQPPAAALQDWMRRLLARGPGRSSMLR